VTVIGLQDFLSAAIARQVKPATLSASAAAPQAPIAPLASLESASSSSISAQSLSTASFSNASVNLAQLSSVLQVSQSGVGQVQSLLQQLEALAGQASGPDVSSATLAKINNQFQQLLAQINRIVAGTTFGDSSVLDGTFSGQQLGSAATGNGQQGSAPKISLPNLSLMALFGTGQTNLLTPEAAAQALAQVGNAKNITSKAKADLQEAQNQTEYASATVQTALTNIDASKAFISDSDLLGVFENILNGLLVEPAASAQLQTANLSPSLLSLLQE
jgi:flagellin